MENRIIEIIEEVTDYNELRDNLDIDLLESEILDSFAFIQLLSKLEEEFSVEIQPTRTKTSDDFCGRI